MEQLEEFGLEEIAPSVIYRMLRDMEARGWVASMWDEEQTQGPPRRIYRITALGDEVLATWVQELDETRKRLDRLVGAYHLHMEEGEGEYH
jgi:PadR family transcriptional regulator PadR